MNVARPESSDRIAFWKGGVGEEFFKGVIWLGEGMRVWIGAARHQLCSMQRSVLQDRHLRHRNKRAEPQARVPAAGLFRYSPDGCPSHSD